MTTTEMLLTILAEECVETAQRVSKAIRFTLEEVQSEQDLTNAQRIVYEFNDVFALMKILVDKGIFKDTEVCNIESMNLKIAKVEKYLAYSKERGTLTD